MLEALGNSGGHDNFSGMLHYENYLQGAVLRLCLDKQILTSGGVMRQAADKLTSPDNTRVAARDAICQLGAEFMKIHYVVFSDALLQVRTYKTVISLTVNCNLCQFYANLRQYNET